MGLPFSSIGYLHNKYPPCFVTVQRCSSVAIAEHNVNNGPNGLVRQIWGANLPNCIGLNGTKWRENMLNTTTTFTSQLQAD